MLLAQGWWENTDKVWLALMAIGVLVGVILLAVFLKYFRFWLQCKLTNARIGLFDLVGMSLRQVDYPLIVRQKIALVQAGVRVETNELEAHYLARGNVP